MNEIQRRKNRRIRRSWLAVVTVVPAALGVAWAALERGPDSGLSAPAQARVLTVLTRTLVAETGYQVPRLFTGQVEAARSSAVGFELDGLVAGIEVEEGDRVTAGQVLATLDSARLQARRTELAAALESASARLAITGPKRAWLASTMAASCSATRRRATAVISIWVSHSFSVNSGIVLTWYPS